MGIQGDYGGVGWDIMDWIPDSPWPEGELAEGNARCSLDLEHHKHMQRKQRERRNQRGASSEEQLALSQATISDSSMLVSMPTDSMAATEEQEEKRPGIHGR